MSCESIKGWCVFVVTEWMKVEELFGARLKGNCWTSTLNSRRAIPGHPNIVAHFCERLCKWLPSGFDLPVITYQRKDLSPPSNTLQHTDLFSLAKSPFLLSEILQSSQNKLLSFGTFWQMSLLHFSPSEVSGTLKRGMELPPQFCGIHGIGWWKQGGRKGPELGSVRAPLHDTKWHWTANSVN